MALGLVSSDPALVLNCAHVENSSFSIFLRMGILRMLRVKLCCTAMLFPAALLILLTDAALAGNSKKLTYEQAYKTCRTLLSKEAIDTNERYSRYGACMARFGCSS
jgi:hypothetical protein